MSRVLAVTATVLVAVSAGCRDAGSSPPTPRAGTALRFTELGPDEDLGNGVYKDRVSRPAASDAAFSAALQEIEEEIRRKTTPTPEQVAEVRERLGPDLEAFARDWGVDPWGR